jgi:hypothetical protein
MPQLLEVEPVATALSAIRTGETRTHGAVAVISLLAPLASDSEWLTLAEAGDRVRMAEVDESGAVPHVTVTNMADRPLLLLDGEQLVGAKQNRILNTTVLIAAGTTLTIPVSCVEQGRWGYRAREFKASGVSLYASARKLKAEWVSRSLRDRKAHSADQAGVWDAIAAKAGAHGVSSATGAMDDFYQRYAADVTASREALASVPGQIGAIVYVGGRWAGLELLASPRLFASAWPRLLAGYTADAIGNKPGKLLPSPGRILAALAEAPTEPAPAVGLGIEYRLSGPPLCGAALVAEERVVHLMAFPAPAGPRAHRS